MALDQILAHKRQEVDQRRENVPEATLRAGLTRSDRSLADSLGRPHTGFILECKRASPSRGVLRPDYDPAAIARTYAPYADALSVLTDERFFGGHHAHLQRARQQVNVPVLCKDFVVDPYQVVEARAHGADAVLLML
jgi:indole-3-glycerol phosphate synthase/phosphoribosylanthranilate isomerase